MKSIRIDKKKLLLNRSGKANGSMGEVSRGCGFHIPKKFKKKTKQKEKNELKRMVW